MMNWLPSTTNGLMSWRQIENPPRSRRGGTNRSPVNRPEVCALTYTHGRAMQLPGAWTMARFR